jgi:hypothetical protein
MSITTERKRLILWIAILATATLLPILLGLLSTPKGYNFGGFIYEARDSVSYLGKALEGQQGQFFYLDPYTSEFQPHSYIFLPYILIGQLSRITPFSLIWLFHIIQLGFLFAIAVELYRVISHYQESHKYRSLSFWVVLLGGGLGFIFAGPTHLGPYTLISLDVGVSGTQGLETLSLAPHILLVVLSSLKLFSLWLKREENSVIWLILRAFIWTLLISLAYPQMAVLWALIFTILLVTKISKPNISLVLGSCLGAIPYVVYGLYLQNSNPIFQGWPPQQDIQIGDPLSYLLWGHFFMFPFLLIALYSLWKKRGKNLSKSIYLLPVTWIFLSAILMYTPGIPIIFHRVFYASFIPFGILAVLGLRESLALISSQKNRQRLLVYGTFLICLITLQVAMEGVTTPLFHRNSLALYFPSNEASVLEALQKSQPTSRHVLMSSYVSGLYVPALSGQTAYLGFPFETLDLAKKQEEVSLFYNTSNKEGLKLQAQKLHITYVLWGKYEKEFGGTDPGQTAGWKTIIQKGDVKIYSTGEE